MDAAMAQSAVRQDLFRLLIVVVSSIPGVAFADGSGGSGGTGGVQEDWPCRGCYFHAPRALPPEPMPLIVALHGDEGDADSYVEYAMPEATLSSGYALLALTCPRDEGCSSGSWYQWEEERDHDPAWVNRMVDTVEGAYDIERNRIYLAGFSGGAMYMSNYLPQNSGRYAGGLYMGGGWTPLHECGECNVPAYFLFGADDYRIEWARELGGVYASCGMETEYEVLSGRGHEIPDDRLPGVYGWFDARPHPCRAAPPTPDPTEPGTGSTPPAPDAGILEPKPPETDGAVDLPDVDGGWPEPDPGAAPRALVGSFSCAVTPGAPAPAAGLLVFASLLVLGARRLRRSAASPSRRRCAATS
jgi:predicted esterase